MSSFLEQRFLFLFTVDSCPNISSNESDEHEKISKKSTNERKQNRILAICSDVHIQFMRNSFVIIALYNRMNEKEREKRMRNKERKK